jgi:hypothetical protein
MIANTKKIWTVGFAAVVLLAGAFVLLPKGAHNGDAVANPLNPATAQDGQTTAPNQWKYNPADPLLPDGIASWPLPSGGSN